MLKENKKNLKKCLFCFNSNIGFNKQIVKNNSLLCKSNESNLEDYLINSKPMINGEEVKHSQVILELKKFINTKEIFHIDGLSCDIQSISKVLNFAEKKKYSINHIDGKRINNFYKSFQKYGGSFTSFNEIKNRSDLMIFLNISEDEICLEFFEKLDWTRKKKKESIFFFNSTQKKSDEFSHISYKEGSFFEELNYLNIDNKERRIKKKFEGLKKKFEKANFPVVLCNIEENNNAQILSIYSLIKLINKKNRLRIYNFLGSNNSSGYTNVCVTKTGYPNSINFTERGSEYEPDEIRPESLKEYIKFQIYISNFEENPKLNFFKNNIFIGNPNFINKNKTQLFIPTKTPGIDCSGLVVRPDGIGVIKLNKKIDSDYPSLSEIFEDLM